MDGNAQVKMTDVIREELMDFIYSDDSVEDANHLQVIFNELELIDMCFSDIDKEMNELRHRIAKLSLEAKHNDSVE